MKHPTRRQGASSTSRRLNATLFHCDHYNVTVLTTASPCASDYTPPKIKQTTVITGQTSWGNCEYIINAKTLCREYPRALNDKPVTEVYSGPKGAPWEEMSTDC